MFFLFSISFMFWKNFSIIYLYKQTSQIDCFRRVHKFWNESGLAILK